MQQTLKARLVPFVNKSGDNYAMNELIQESEQEECKHTAYSCTCVCIVCTGSYIEAHAVCTEIVNCSGTIKMPFKFLFGDTS